MRVLYLVFFIRSIAGFALEKDAKYPVSEIPAALKEKMYAVVREKSVNYRIVSKSNSIYSLRQVITVLNKKASGYAVLTVSYDKMSSIKSLGAIVYNEQGVEIKKVKQNDFEDRSTFDGFSLYNDNRIKTLDLSQTSYPYTIEIEYVIENRFLYSFPDFYVYYDDEVSAQLIEYSITYPQALKPRYKSFNAGEPVVVRVDEKNESMRWKFSNVVPEKFEPYSPFHHQVVPNIAVSPIAFEFGGYEGNMESWRNYGSWQILLNNGRGELPASTKLKILELTGGLASVEEKTKVLYEYLQKKTRYVSIQEGIGGLQPFPAAVVDEVGYGDCKALSNYMVALLREAGIKGYYTKIRAGKNEPDLQLDFPSHQTNHIIVAVPNVSDTLWLECTSQTNPFGYLGSFTGNRFGLMITETGGQIVKTPNYSAQQNTQVRYADIFINESGDATTKVLTTYTGLKYETDDLDQVLENIDEQKKWIEKNVQIPSFDIVSFSLSSHKSKIPVSKLNLELKLNRLVSVSGKRIFLTPNLMNRSTFVPEILENRKLPVIRHRSYTDLDSILYHLPEAYYPEFIPKSTEIRTLFGVYESSYSIQEGELLYIRRLKMNKGEFPPESYNELIAFYKAINKADNTKIVFVNKT